MSKTAGKFESVAREKTSIERSFDKLPTLYISAGIVTIIATLIWSNLPATTKAPLLTGLWAVFGVFCVSILVFAIAYQRLYQKNSEHFLFNEAISKRQKEVVESESRKELAIIAKRIVLMSDLLTEFVENKAVIEPKTYDVVLTSGLKYSFHSMPPLGGVSSPIVFLSVSDENGTTILSDCILPYSECPLKPQQFRDLAHSTIKTFSRQTLELEQRLASLPSSSPRVWSLLDFIYFSTVIQATVGLGDILPNSTVVRCVVAAQVLIGYVIVLVALNMVLSIFH
jgi:Ion channel